MSGRESLLARAGQRLQRLPIGWLRPLERLALRGRQAGDAWVIFIIAPPRSGSTVFYQTLVHALSPAYLSNLWHMLYQVPLLGSVVSRLKCGGHRSDFRSARGFVSGLCGPAEGLRFWEYWFGQGLSEISPVEATSTSRQRHIQRILALASSPERPFVAGYVGHALFIPQLRSLFPRAVFVRLRRDPAANASSIAAIRREMPPASPFSVTPRELAEHLGTGIPEESAAQVWHINRRIDEDAKLADTLDVSYEDLCADPGRVVGQVVAFCNARGYRLRKVQALPGRLDSDRKPGVDEAVLSTIHAAFADLASADLREKKR